MHNLSVLLIFFSLGGCASNEIPDDSKLPWNKPASWELKRDVSTSLQKNIQYKGYLK